MKLYHAGFHRRVDRQHSVFMYGLDTSKYEKIAEKGKANHTTLVVLESDSEATSFFDSAKIQYIKIGVYGKDLKSRAPVNGAIIGVEFKEERKFEFEACVHVATALCKSVVNNDFGERGVLINAYAKRKNKSTHLYVNNNIVLNREVNEKGVPDNFSKYHMLTTTAFSEVGKLPFYYEVTGICNSPPGEYIKTNYFPLSPSNDLLLKSRTIDWDKYTEEYVSNVLCKLNPKKVAQDIGYIVAMACFEKTPPCHRFLAAEWLQSNGIDVSKE